MKKAKIVIRKMAERVLAELQLRGMDTNVYACEAIVESIIPRDSKLRADSLYILGLLLGNEINPNMKEFEKDEQFMNVFYIISLVIWCQQGHQIRNPKYLKAIMGYFATSGTTEEELSEETREYYKKGVNLVQSVDPNYTNNTFGLGKLANDILEHWEELYQEELAYDVILACISEEHFICKFNTFESVALARKIEDEYIQEKLK